MNILSELKQINTFIFDVDGILTDGKVFLLPNKDNEEYLMARAMHTRDGYALQLAVKKGYKIAVITGGNYAGVEYRLKGLGIKHIYSSVKDKLACLKEYLQKENTNSQNTLFMGDDIPDYEAMNYCGVRACPTDAVNEIKSISQYISPFKGGKGCVRDVIEKVLKLRNDWDLITHISSK